MLSPEQLEFRKSGVGASEAFHLFPASWTGFFRKKAEQGLAGADWLYRLKRGEADEVQANFAMRAGSFFEACILDHYGEEHGLMVADDQESRAHPGTSHILATPDGLAWEIGDPDSAELVEIKCVAKFAWRANSNGYRGWQDGPPLRVQIQCQQQMYVTGRKSCTVLAMVSGSSGWSTHARYVSKGVDPRVAFGIAVDEGAELFTYELDRDDEFIDTKLVPAIGDFWKCVQDGIPPSHREVQEATEIQEEEIQF